MTVQEMIDILEQQEDKNIPVVVRTQSDQFIDDFVDIVPAEVNVIEARKIGDFTNQKNTYDASIHAKVDTKVVSLSGKSITRPY